MTKDRQFKAAALRTQPMGDPEVEARYSALFQCAPVGIIIGSPECYCIDANPGMCQMLGFTRDELVGLHASEYIVENAIPNVGAPQVCQFRRKDGSIIEAEMFAAVMPDGTRLEFVLDITTRKQAADDQIKLGQHLRDQHFYTRSLIESNIDALMTTDALGIITDVNRQTEALTGCTRDELIGSAFSSCFTDPKRAEAGIKRVLIDGKLTNYELTARARDGKLTVVSYNATTLHDRHRRLQGVFAAARDITERKQYEETLREATQRAEQANREMLHLNASLEQQVLERTATLESARRQLQESNERFAIAADSAGIGVWEFSVISNSFTWDNWMYRIYGHTGGSDVEPYSLWVSSLHPEDRARCEARFGAAVRGERDFDPEFRIVRPSGEVRRVRATSRTLRGADGSALTLTGVNLDVTELRRAQEAESIKRHGEC